MWSCFETSLLWFVQLHLTFLVFSQDSRAVPEKSGQLQWCHPWELHLVARLYWPGGQGTSAQACGEREAGNRPGQGLHCSQSELQGGSWPDCIRVRIGFGVWDLVPQEVAAFAVLACEPFSPGLQVPLETVSPVLSLSSHTLEKSPCLMS